LRKKDKYPYLSNNDVKTTKWQKLKPVEPYYFFVPKDFALQSEYEKFWKITEIFKEYSSGVQTKRDNLAVNIDNNILRTNFLMFKNLNLPNEIIEKTFKVTDTYEWTLTEAREKVSKDDIDEKIKKYYYRPFDQRWIYYSDAVLARPFKRVMKHLFSENLAIATSRKYPGTKIFGSIVIDFIGDIHSVAGQTYFFPLYLYKQKESKKGSSRSKVMVLFEPGAGYEIKEPNFSPVFTEQITDCCKRELPPEEIFNYIYAILYSPTYRKKYEEFLKIDFPRIPLPSNYKVFKELSTLGKELVELHLLKSLALNETEVGFPKGNSNIVEKVSYEEENQSVFINKEQYFEGISKEMWEYRIGAYQVMQKYLKDRKKRKLSLDEVNHYMKVAKAIQLTIELQGKIDEVNKKNKI